MPYTIRKRDGRYCVVKQEDPDGHSFGCHDTEQEAKNQIAAIEASEHAKADEGYVRVRVKDPGLFQQESFRTISIDAKQGIKAIIGKLKGETSTTVQVYLFDPEKWDMDKAKQWVKEHEAQKSALTLESRPNVSPKSKWVLRVLGAPYGTDAHGQFFSTRTNFYLGEGETRPVMYAHGERPEGGEEMLPVQVGIAKAAERDEKGQWFDVVLDKTSEYARRLWDAAKDGLVRASSGTVDYLVRLARNGEILSWPIGELTLMDLGGSVHAPAHAGAIAYMKSMDGQIRSLEALTEDESQFIAEIDAKDAPLTEPDSADTERASNPSAADTEAALLLLAMLSQEK